MTNEPMEALDRIRASLGDLDARERLLRRHQLAVQERLADQAEPQGGTVPTPPLEIVRAGSRRSRGASETTLAAIRACAAVIHRDGPPSRGGAFGLAKHAADLAQKLGLQGADALDPTSSSMRAIAAAFIEGVQAAQKAP
jgi:hypothetical protein